MDNQKAILLVVGVLIAGLLIGNLTGEAVRRKNPGGGGDGSKTTSTSTVISTSTSTSTSPTTTIASDIIAKFRQGENGYSGSDDAYLNQLSPNTNFANGLALAARKSTVSENYYTLVKYNISSIPSTATIINVNLMETTYALCCNNPGTTIGVYEMTTPEVNIQAATWYTRDGGRFWNLGAFSSSDYNPSALAQGTFPAGGALKFNISGTGLTSYVQSRLSAGTIWLVLANDGPADLLNDMNSNEVSVIGTRPKLFVTYTTIRNFILGPGEYNMTLPGFSNRDYKIYIPGSYDKLRPMPVVIVLHGGGGNPWTLNPITCPDGDPQNPKCMDKLAEREGFILVYPSGIENPDVEEVRSWNAGGGRQGYACVSGYACGQGIDDVAYIKALLDNLDQVVNIDKTRVYAAGISNGAAMTHRLACEMAGRITAIAPISYGNQYSAVDSCTPSRSMPVIEFHGTADPFAPYEGGVVNLPFGLSGKVIPIQTTIEDWAARNGCSTSSTIELADISNDDTTVTKISFNNCRNNADIVLYRINNGGHTWPDGQQYSPPGLIGNVTRDINANELMWEFFQRYSL